MPPLFDENQQFDESELEDSLANKAPRSHKSMLILKCFNPETGDLTTFLEHFERVESTDNTAMDKFSASDDTKRHKKCSKKFKEREDNSKKYCKKNSSLYCSLHGENSSHTSGEWKVLKARASNKYKPKYGKKENKKKFKDFFCVLVGTCESTHRLCESTLSMRYN